MINKEVRAIPQGNYFLAHWRGELPLWVSFWANLVLIAVALRVLDLWISRNLPVVDMPFIAILMALYAITMLVIYIWQIVGVWRSADRDKAETKGKMIGGIVQFLIVIGVLSTIGAIRTALPKYADIIQTTFSGDSAQETRPVDAQLVEPELTVLVSRQDSEGVTQDQMDLEFLANLEKYTLERVKTIVADHYESRGEKPPSLGIKPESNYIELGDSKLAILRFFEGEKSNSVYVFGIIGNEMVRVLCASKSKYRVEITTGECGAKISEVFRVSFQGSASTYTKVETPQSPTLDNYTFAKLNFNNDIFIDVPKNWKYLDKNQREHIQTASEAVVHLESLPAAEGKSTILLAANAYTGYKTSSATVRLSVQYGPGGTQEEVQQLSRATKSQQDEVFIPALAHGVLGAKP